MLVDIIDAMRRGDLAAALATARGTLAAEPENAAVHHLLGVCLQQAGDLAGARKAFDRALELAPDVAAHHFSLATLKLAQGDAPGAIRGLQDALGLDPNQLGAYVLLAHLALGRGDQAEAGRQLRLAQRVNAEHPQVRVVEGYVAQAEGDADRALKCFTAAAEADPNLAAAHLALGQAYLARRMWPFAEQALVNALRLDNSRAPSTLRALVEARRRQGKLQETLEALDELLKQAPDDLGARALRAEVLVDAGEGERAVADLLALLDRNPTHGELLRRTATQLVRLGRRDEAVARVDAALEADPSKDDAWRMRHELASAAGEDPRPVLDRWLAALPQSAAGLELMAAWHEARGEDEAMERFADQALAINPDLYASNLVKVRRDLERDPEAALARVDAMLAKATAPGLKNVLGGWRGTVLDVLGRREEAARAWRERLVFPAPYQVPPPPVLPAKDVREGTVAGHFVWNVPGANTEFLLRRLHAALGPRVRLDRTKLVDSDDGFGRMRFPPGHAEAGSAATWTRGVQAAGFEPSQVVDWIPHVDPYTFAALAGGRWTALVIDPRDALLNWLVRGCVQGYLFMPPTEQAASWLAGSLEALLAHQQAHPDEVAIVRLDADAGAAAATLEQRFGLPEPLPALFGRAPRFPSGHWREYRQAFAAEFDLLAPAAQRLGYPAE